MRFDLCGELPETVTVLEASAGTGKTYTIAGLAARYVAEGRPLDKLLLVTFTRLATGELRERVRRRLAEVAAGLEGAPSEDPVVELLKAGDRELHLANLRRALADFDAATIATTHAFCQEMLSGLGIAGDHEPETQLVEDVRDLKSEVIDDLFVWRLSGGNANERPAYDEAQRIAEAATEHAIDLAAAPEGMGRTRFKTAEWARRVLGERKRRMAIVTYDDLVLRLGAALAAGPEAVAKLRERYEVVLVDEFQDTDPDQWDILRTAFGDRALVLIGDPKQAIYAFRGGDVYAYLDAAGTVERQVLDRNHRSDGPLVKALDAVFDGAQLGHPEIAYLPVQAVHEEPRLSGAKPGALRIRFALRQDLPALTGKGYAGAPATRDYVARDTAEDIAELLGSDAEIEGRPVRPSDIAVLVRNRWQARDVCEALGELDVPAVIAGAGSVFDTDAAREWLRLLEALERPGSGPRAHAAALTCFWGWSAANCAAADDERWEGVHDTLHRWAQVLRARGVASLVETVTREQDLAARMLGELGGERALTDVRHIGQLLHAAALADGLGPTALTQWLRRRIAEAERDTADEDRSRRLESDARAVQVLTVHRAKGLEFGVVYLPYQWDLGQGDRRPQPVMFHDGTKRLLDVSLTGDDYQAHKQRQLAEQRGEELRLLYVALTRARHQVVLWWAATWAARDSALGRLLFARQGPAIPDSADEPPSDERATEVFRALVRASEGTIALERASRSEPVGSWPGEPSQQTELAVARFTRELDTAWRRTSYSALTMTVHEAPQVTSEPEEPGVQDEPEGGATATGPWAEVPVGMRVGTVVHRALEAVDFAAPVFGAEIAELGAEAGLRAALETPLGDPFGVRLADIATADRLDELDFELPLTGGTLERLAEVLRAHGDPYGERLAEVEAEELHGFLTGSLDLVARLPDRRFAIFDYKTNGLAAFGADALREEMYRRHYVLQALLYAVALRRYLRWRAPEAEIAGVGYLFLRGMDGADGAGVFAWTPSPELLGELDAAL
jgi:exodeoxyribonuclease V beta subunit